MEMCVAYPVKLNSFPLRTNPSYALHSQPPYTPVPPFPIGLH